MICAVKVNEINSIFNKKRMKDLTEYINEGSQIKGLRPTFYFNNMEFFETMTNPDEQGHITASYEAKQDRHFIYFFYKMKQIGYLKLKPIL